MKKVWCAVFATAFFVVSCMEHDMYYIAVEKPQIVPELGIAVPGKNINDKFAWLQANAKDGESYIIEFDDDTPLAPQTFSYDNENITIHLKGIGGRRTIKLPDTGSVTTGSMFTVSEGVTLVLDDNITLEGRTDNNTALVKVNNGGKLRMNSGSVITGNINYGDSNYDGGGVFVNGGTFTMTGGTISSNGAITVGSGVVVQNGTFTMYNGTISNNEAGAFAGGVAVFGALSGGSPTFTMNGGTISNNKAGQGGGVHVWSAKVTMNGGTISDNEAMDIGGGVVVQDGTFTMNNGQISGNKITGTANNLGGGVHIAGSLGAVFNMHGGIISRNTATNSGNGNGRGGGVYVGYQNSNIYGVFNKTGGIIYGSNAGVNSNSASTEGQAACWRIDNPSSYRLRDLTAGNNDALLAAENPSGGTGWEN